MSAPRFLWAGPAGDPSGHADELRGFLRAQEAAGDRPVLHELYWTDKRVELSPEDRAMIRRQAGRGRHGFDVAVHTYLPHGSHPLYEGAVNVHRVMFETDRLPSVWVEPLLARDEVWVPCRHNYEVFADSGLPASKMRIVGGTLDFDLFAPGAEPYDLDSEPGRFVFLTNFDFSARKGWETLLRAWARAFTEDDPVCLVLKTGSFYKEDGYVERRIATFMRTELGNARVAPVHMLTDLLPASEMPRLYAGADAYVLASRGEGWGRPYMEAQAMGLPTIASAWGGQLEFMDADTSWLVEGSLVPVPDDSELFNTLYQGHRWFEPDVDDLAAKLRDIAADPEAARRRAAPARERLIERFGSEATATTLREAAAAALERRARPGCVIRGSFGSTASLAVVNDGLTGGLERQGVTVHTRAPGGAPLPAAVPTISHAWPHDFSPASEGPTVMVMPWEYGAPPAEWVRDARRHADRVWVYSRYLRDRYVCAGLPPGIVEVVPLGFDPARFAAEGPAIDLPVQAACTFLFVGGTIWRKGIDLLLDAWAEAFGPGDDVALVIKDFGTTSWYRGQTAGEEMRGFLARDDIAPVAYLDGELPARELALLYRCADVLVAPYRGEGFCLPALEAMACGLPVIHTATGPTGEFVPDDAGWAVEAREAPVPDRFELPELSGPAVVQEVDRSALVAALRDAASDPAGRARRARVAIRAAASMTWTEVAASARESLETLARESLPPARLAHPESVEVLQGRTLVAYSPRWYDEQAWSRALLAWASTFDASDPVTLALHCDGADPQDLAERILARLSDAGCAEESLPDLMLCEADISLADLVAAAHAVMVDEVDRGRPELVRRALRVLAPDAAELLALKAAVAAAPVLTADTAGAA